MPYSSIYTKVKPSTTEFMFIHYPKTANLPQPIKLKNTKNSYRGSSLVNEPEAIKELKNKGIQTVIAIDYGGSDYKEQVENAGMKHLKLNLLHFTPQDKKQLDNFSDIIGRMKEDNFYIGCMLGERTTTKFLNITDYFLNPNGYYKVQDISTLATVENILETLTPEQKEKMKLTEEDEAALFKRINKEYYHFYDPPFKK